MDARGDEPGHHVADRHVHQRDDADDGRIGRATLGLVDGAAQHEVRDDDEHEDEVGGQTRLPRPPHAPLEARPHLARGHRAHHEQKRDLHADLRARVEALLFGHEKPYGVVSRERKRCERHDGHRHVEIEDLLRQQQLGRHHLAADELHAVNRRAVHRSRVEKRHQKADGGEHRPCQKHPRRDAVGPLPHLGQLRRPPLRFGHTIPSFSKPTAEARPTLARARRSDSRNAAGANARR